MTRETNPRDDYDTPWKHMLARYFPAFLEFFFPAAYQGIDWSRNYTLLDKELHKVTRDAALGQRRADALVRVTGRDGADDWVLVHVEVQGENTADFAQRMFVYNYRSYDLYGRPVISLAVLGEPYQTAHGKFGYGRWGSLMRLRFPVVSLNAYRPRWAELEASANPFAVVTQAHLRARETAGLDEARYRVKRELIRSLYRRGYQRPAILDLLRFVDWVLALPEGLENQLWAEVQQFEEEKHMRYVSSLEQIAIRKGIEKGIEKGREQTLCELLEELLVTRLGPLSETIRSRLAGANSAQLSLWFRRALTAPSLESVFAGGEG